MAPFVALCVWSLAAMALAPLPIRYQIVPGLCLLIALPVLLVWIGQSYGVGLVVVGLIGAASLYRKPLAALMRFGARKFEYSKAGGGVR